MQGKYSYNILNGNLNKGGEFMSTGIRPQGKCPECGSKWEWHRTKFFRCPNHHHVNPKLFLIDFKHKGERFRRGTDLNGNTLRYYKDASDLYAQAQSERVSKEAEFDPYKWRVKGSNAYAFSKLVREWYKEKYMLSCKPEGASKKVGYEYASTMKRHAENCWIPYFGDKDVRHIINLNRFTNQLDCSPQYASDLQSTLMQFFKWTFAERLITRLPEFETVDVIREFQTVDKETQLKFIELLPEHAKPIFTYMIYQGARPSEVCALKWDSVSFDDVGGGKVIYQRTLKTIDKSQKFILFDHTKNGKDRDNYLYPEARRILPQKSFPDNFVFTRPNGNHHNRNSLHKIYRATKKHWLKKYGDEIQCTMYEFTKHSFGTQFIEKYGPESLYALKEHFGHSNIKTTEKYVNVKPVDMVRQMYQRVSKGSVTPIRSTATPQH